MASIRYYFALILCVLLLMLPVYSQPQNASQHAGQVDALIPAATRNDQPVKVKDDLQWNDLLKTAHNGRVRASLADGSILSVGSNSELRVVQHDAASQQTSLEMNFGKIRSQVQKITKPGGKFEIKTPNAVIGVVGTDFYAAFSGTKTTVICYEGRVTVTPIAQAAAVTLSAGQMVVIDSAIPPGGFHASDVSPKLQQSAMLSTDVPTTLPAAVHPGAAGHAGWIFLGSAVAVGTAIGVTSTRNTGATSCQTGPLSAACPGSRVR